jgi:hypothetical protein
MFNYSGAIISPPLYSAGLVIERYLTLTPSLGIDILCFKVILRLRPLILPCLSYAYCACAFSNCPFSKRIFAEARFENMGNVRPRSNISESVHGHR